MPSRIDYPGREIAGGGPQIEKPGSRNADPDREAGDTMPVWRYAAVVLSLEDPMTFGILSIPPARAGRTISG
ncbi:hypothetical protein GCM10009099_30860 [Caenispirillum bisanense]